MSNLVIVNGNKSKLKDLQFELSALPKMLLFYSDHNRMNESVSPLTLVDFGGQFTPIYRDGGFFKGGHAVALNSVGIMEIINPIELTRNGEKRLEVKVYQTGDIGRIKGLLDNAVEQSGLRNVNIRYAPGFEVSSRGYSIPIFSAHSNPVDIRYLVNPHEILAKTSDFLREKIRPRHASYRLETEPVAPASCTPDLIS